MLGYFISAFVGFIGGVVFSCFYDVTIEDEE